MRESLQSADQPTVSDDMLVRAWSDYSDGVCAVWIALADDDVTLLNTLRKRLPHASATNTTPVMWHSRIRDATDGTGDGILELPDALMSQLKWKVGDKLAISLNDSGEMVLRRKK
jgi:hypothetical protein